LKIAFFTSFRSMLLHFCTTDLKRLNRAERPRRES
jgi:hypothetical protein